MANEVILTVTEEERRIAREISKNNYQRMIKLESEIAREKGHSEGYAEGHAEGHAEGKQEKARETARLLKQLGDSTDKIARVTGLSESEIEKL